MVIKIITDEFQLKNEIVNNSQKFIPSLLFFSTGTGFSILGFKTKYQYHVFYLKNTGIGLKIPGFDTGF